MKKAAFIFMIISCVLAVEPLSSFVIYGYASTAIAVYVGSLVSLAWKIPMTVYAYKWMRGERTLSTGFKVCSLIFASLIAGILMLCVKEEEQTVSRPTPTKSPSSDASNLTCLHCGKPIKPTDRFCPSCGWMVPTSTKRACPKCGEAVQSVSSFCPHCGASLSSGDEDSSKAQ